MTRVCQRYVRVMDLWEYLLRRNANRDGRGELCIWRKTAMNLQEKHQGVKHRKPKEKDVFVPNNSSLFQVKGYLPYTYITFFPKTCIMYCCIKKSLNFYYIYNSKEQTPSRITLQLNDLFALNPVVACPSWGLLSSFASLMSYPLLGLLSGFSLNVVLQYYYTTHF